MSVIHVQFPNQKNLDNYYSYNSRLPYEVEVGSLVVVDSPFTGLTPCKVHNVDKHIKYMPGLKSVYYSINSKEYVKMLENERANV